MPEHDASSRLAVTAATTDLGVLDMDMIVLS